MKNRFLKHVIPMAMSGMIAIGGLPVNLDAAETAAIIAETTPDTEITNAPTVIDGYIYGTVNVPYADFYYGEIYDTAASTDTIPRLDVDLAGDNGLRNEGFCDVVSSATTQKATQYAQSYYETSENGVKIYGIKGVKVAISESLYNNILSAKAEGIPCSNKLYELVDNMTFSQSAYTTEYKTINADGTLSKMNADSTVLTDATATISSATRWGNFQVKVNGLPASVDGKANLIGIMLETASGLRVPMLHSSNLWFKAYEFAFAVTPGFKEPHGNTIPYQAAKALQGETITKITYMIDGESDYVINTDLKVKTYPENDSVAIAIDNADYLSDGISTKVNISAPADSNFSVSRVTSSTETLNADQFNYANGILSLKGDFRPGTYTVTFSDDKYVDQTSTFVIISPLKSDEISITNNKLSINSTAASLDEYISAITGITVNGKAFTGSNLGATIFNEDGSINFEAVIKGRGSSTPVFEAQAQADYEIVVTATGYPSINTTVGKSQHVHTTTTTIIPASFEADGSIVTTCADGDLDSTEIISRISSVSLNKTAFSYNGKVQKPSVTAMDANGKVISSDSYTVSYSKADSKAAGKYNVIVTFKGNYSGSKTLSYSINAASSSKFKVTAANTSFTYNGKVQKPSVTVKDASGKAINSSSYTVSYATSKKPGKYNLKVTFKGNYSGSKTISYTIKPAKASVTTKALSKSSAKVSFKKVAGIDGYQIQYSTSPSFKKATTVKINKSSTSSTLNKLKKKTKYYVRVRSYAGSVYSDWSATKTVTTKK